MHDHRLYRALTRLYPSDFRDRYRDDLVQHHADLIGERGNTAAWTRTGLDLLVTVPRYRLETIMNNRHSTATLDVIIGLVAAAGIAAFAGGFIPGIGLVVIAALFAITQRNAMARSIRTPNSSQRAHRLHLAAVSAGIFGACVIGFMIVTWDGEASSLGLLGTSVPGTAALVAAVGFLAAGLLTPRDSTNAAH